MKIISNRTITEKEGYEAMIYMLNNFLELTGSNDLVHVLEGSEYVEADTPADSAFWDYWVEAVDMVKKNGPPPLKVLYKP